MPSRIDSRVLIKNLLLMADKGKNVKAGLLAVAESVKEDAMPLTPEDTKDLKNSWTIEEISDNEILAGYDIVYAMYQHQGRRSDGTHIIRNRPAGGESFFLVKAIDRDPLKHLDAFAQAMKVQIGL